MGSLAIISSILPMMLIPIFILSVLYFFKSPWFMGFTGEMLVHLSTKIHLNKDKYHVLRNVMLPTTDGTTQIDHLIVSEYGIFVIETENMKGWIFGGAHQRMWTQKIFKYSKKFQNPLHQNYKHVETLKSILELNDQQIFSIVIFVGDSTFKTEMPKNVINGSGLIRFIKAKDRPVMSDDDVQEILAKIEAEHWLPSFENSRAQKNHVKQIVDEKQNSDICPQCGSPMIVREMKKGFNPGEKFLGCTRFPECRGTAVITSNYYRWGQEIETDLAFTDSWENKSWQNDDIQSGFTDRAFQ